MTILMHEKFQGWGSSAINSGFSFHMTCPENGLASMKCMWQGRNTLMTGDR
jgi:hypothetical protein